MGTAATGAGAAGGAAGGAGGGAGCLREVRIIDKH